MEIIMRRSQLRFFKTIIFCGVMLTLSAFSSEFNYTGPELSLNYSGPVIVDNSRFEYTASDRLTFYTDEYLTHNLPKLLPIREAIDTWAALFSIHPRLLSEVMNNYFYGKTVDNAFEHKQKVFEIAAGLNQGYEEQKDDLLAASKAVNAIADVYAFDLNLNAELATKRVMVEHDYFRGNSGPPLYSYFHPPWPQGELWAGGGVHSNTGSGNGPRNSLDFFKTFVSWGGDTSETWVSASGAGIARVFSTCSMQVIHPNGWVSSYYHLDNVQVEDMDNVNVNQSLSNYADNLAQATCQGGSSTGPHLHYSLYFDNDPIEIDEPNVDFISWKHKAGVGQYDGNCATSYYTLMPGGNTVCPFNRNLTNNTIIDDLIFGSGFE